MSIFARLGYDSANTTSQNLSSDVITTMNRMPPLLNEWQTTDAGNSDTTGYFINPNATVTNNTWNIANSIIAITGISSISNLSVVLTSANNLGSAANNFLLHTNRLSGLAEPNASTATLPHYNSAMGLGKVVMQIVFQSDGVQNNAPIMGNFTSITCGNTLNSKYSTITTYPNTIINSVSTDGLGNYYSNLTSTQINTIANNISDFANYMNSRRTADVNFYLNSQYIVSDYNTLKQFSNPGETELNLLTNYIGSTKLLTRLNS